MNCRHTETFLLAERDGGLSPAQHAALASHLAECPACRQLRVALAEASDLFKAEAATVAVPDPDEAWQLVRAELAANRTERGRTAHSKKRPLAPMLWFGAPLAAAVAVAFAFFVATTDSNDSGVQTAQANFVEAGDSNASTMVYVDKESGWLVVWASE